MASNSQSSDLLGIGMDLDYFDPAPAWRYLVTLPALKGFSARPPRPWRCLATNAPLPSIENEQDFFAGSAQTYPTGQTYKDVTLEFLENGNSYDILAYLMHWKGLVITDEGHFGLPKDYKLPVKLEAMDVRGVKTGTWDIKRMWLTDVEGYSYTSENGERVRCTAQFKVFQAKFTPYASQMYNGNSMGGANSQDLSTVTGKDGTKWTTGGGF